MPTDVGVTAGDIFGVDCDMDLRAMRADKVASCLLLMTSRRLTPAPDRR
jgi:hypothetical protein